MGNPVQTVSKSPRAHFWEKPWYKFLNATTTIWGYITGAAGGISGAWKYVHNQRISSEEIAVFLVYSLAVFGAVLSGFVVADWSWKNFEPEKSRTAFLLWLGIPCSTVFLIIAFSPRRIFLAPVVMMGLFGLVAFAVAGVVKLRERLR